MVGAVNRCSTQSAVITCNSHFPLVCLGALPKLSWDKSPSGYLSFQMLPSQLRAKMPHPRDLPGLVAGRFRAGGASHGSSKGRHKL